MIWWIFENKQLHNNRLAAIVLFYFIIDMSI